MAGLDQLEIIGPGGEVTFYSLDPSRGITNIGRHPENDVVLQSGQVAPFHAVLDHRQKPYQFVVLSAEGQTRIGGESLSPNVARELRNWDTIELDGHSLILLEASGPAPRTDQPTAYAQAPAPYAYPTAPPASPPVRSSASSSTPSTPAPRAGPPPTAIVPARPASAGAPAGPAEGGAASMADLDQILSSLDQMAELPPDHTDNIVVVQFEAQEFALDPDKKSTLDFAVEVEQSASFQATIINGGDIVAAFDLHVEGLDPAWVRVSQSQVNLFEGERATVSVSLTAPRLPSSRAGAHYFSVVVTSPNYPGHSSAMSGMLLVRPFHEFGVGDVSPKQQSIAWSKKFGQAVIPVINRGNSNALFRVEGEDDERGCGFEFVVPGETVGLARQAEFRVPANTELEVPIRITPHRRQLIGLRSHTYGYTITTTPLDGQQSPRSVVAQARSAPLIGPWLIALILILLAALVVLIFRPTISYFGTDPALERTGAVSILAGESVDLYWRASPFAGLRIDPEIGALEQTSGSMTVAPLDTTTYILLAENLLTRLSPNLFSERREVQVVVGPVLPTIVFTATTPDGTDTMVRGQSLTLSWQVSFADEVVLISNGAPETIAADQHTGSRVVFPESDSTYILQARNRYTGQDGVIAKLAVKVLEPTATPLPLPVIQRFDVQPLVITEGVSIRLEWAVSGVDKVSITPLGTDFAPNGVIEVSPKETTTYLLIATNGKDSVQLSRQVLVNPAPTPAPPPEAPKIEFFTLTPSEVVQGSKEAAAVQLAWSVTGDTTNIEISGPDFGRVSNLQKQGSLTLTADKSTLYIITAFNGSLSSSQTAQIKVVAPTATPTGTPPPTPTGTPSPTPPLPVLIFSAAADDPKESANVVAASTTLTNTYKYQIVAGTRVKFSWNATNAVKVVFMNEDKAPADSTTLVVVAAGTHTLTAYNAFGGTTQIFIQIELTPRPVPPSPSNVNGALGSSGTGVTLSWTYDTTALGDITGFRIFRAMLPSVDFTPIGDEDKTPPFTYVDPGGACGMAYYVVAVYTGLNLEELLTDPSANSWNTPACVAPTPTP